MTSPVPDQARRLVLVATPEIAQRKPEWMKRRIPLAGEQFHEIRRTVTSKSLHTVCQEAACPNISQCWGAREASFLIGGDVCTRKCGFCNIATGKPSSYDKLEPTRVAKAVAEMGLHFAVVTGVARDDQPDGAAWLYAETSREIHRLLPHCGVELLIPDFRGRESALHEIFDGAPEVLAHNIETVPRLFKHTRPAFRYDKSLEVLSRTRDQAPHIARKSNIMLGLGEREEEVKSTMRDLLDAGCQIVTINQYLQPSHNHMALQRYAKPDEYVMYREYGLSIGFAHVEAGPLVRSSYKAGDQAISAGVWRRPTEADQAAIELAQQRALAEHVPEPETPRGLPLAGFTPKSGCPSRQAPVPSA